MITRLESDLIAPVELLAQTPDFRETRPIDGIISGDFTSRYNALCTGEFTLPVDHHMNAYLRTPGAGVIVRHRDGFKMSGMIRDPKGRVARKGADVLWQIEGDWRILPNTLAWPAPRQALKPMRMEDLGQSWQTSPPGPDSVTQGRTGIFRFPDGVDSAEACIKHLIEENLLHRLGRPVTVAPNQDRGGNARAAGLIATSEIRMQPVDEALAPFLEYSGLRLQVSRDPGRARGYIIDVVETGEFDRTLDYDNGILAALDYDRKDATASRLVLGGVGDAAERIFRLYVDRNVERSSGGDVIEVYHEDTEVEPRWNPGTEGRDTAPVFAHLSDKLSAAAKNTLEGGLRATGFRELAAAASKLSLTVELEETPSFYLGGAGGLQEGTILRVLQDGVAYTDRLTASTVSQGDSLTVKATLGSAPSGEDDELWDQISRLYSAITKRNG